MDDHALIDLLRNDGDAGAQALCSAYAPLAAAIARRVLTDQAEDVEEVAADTIFTVWRKRTSLRPDTLRGFVIATARNLAIDRWRVLRRRNEGPLFDWDGEDTAYLEEFVLGEELQRRVLAVSPPDGELFLRHYVLLEGAKELAERFGITESAVRSRLHRTRKKLRQEVKRDE